MDSHATKAQSKDIVGFHFQIIPLVEAQSMALAGSGNYADLKAKLLEQIPLLKPDESFAFGSPKIELSKIQRRSICKAVNITFNKANLSWKVVYSDVKRLFICIPRDSRSYYKKREETTSYIPRSRSNNIDDEPILKLWNKGATVLEIVKQTGVPLGHVKYVCYQKNTSLRSRTGGAHGQTLENKNAAELQALLKAASRIFNVTEEQIKKGGSASAVRKAVCVVAMERHIPTRLIAEYIGFTQGGVRFIALQKPGYPDKEIETLRKLYRS